MKTLLLTLLTIPSLAFGQEGQKHLRLIPLGQPPEWKEKLDPITGIRIGDEPPPGSFHPSPITASDGKNAAQSVNPGMGAFSSYLKFGPKIAKLDLFEGKIPAGKPWLTAAMPEFEVALGVLFRDPAGMTWLKPRILFLDDGKEAFPDGSIRFVNVSEQNALVKIGKKAGHRIKPGDFLVLPLVEGNNALRVGYEEKAKGNRVGTIFPNNTIRVIRGQRIQAFIYKNQRKQNDAEPLFLWKPEPLPAL